MQGAAWIGLLRRIPPALHDSLVLMTTTGFEIVLHRLIRLDRDFLVALGRLSGSTDQPKLLIIPYLQMTYLSFNKKMDDAEIDSVLGRPGTTPSPAERPTAARYQSARPEDDFEVIEFPKETPAVAAVAQEKLAAEQADSDGKGQKAQPPSKTILLARLRQRLADDIAKPPSR